MRSAFATHSTPSDVNSRIRLNEATVDIGTQWSGLAVYSVHINLQGSYKYSLWSLSIGQLPVKGKIRVRKVEFDWVTLCCYSKAKQTNCVQVTHFVLPPSASSLSRPP